MLGYSWQLHQRQKFFRVYKHLLCVNKQMKIMSTDFSNVIFIVNGNLESLTLVQLLLKNLFMINEYDLKSTAEVVRPIQCFMFYNVSIDVIKIYLIPLEMNLWWVFLTNIDIEWNKRFILYKIFDNTVGPYFTDETSVHLVVVVLNR